MNNIVFQSQLEAVGNILGAIFLVIGAVTFLVWLFRCLFLDAVDTDGESVVDTFERHNMSNASMVLGHSGIRSRKR